MKVTVWTPLQTSLPNGQTLRPFDHLRTNIIALAVGAAASIAPGWNYTNSKTLAEGSPGTAALPARKYWTHGAGNDTQWLKMACTYTGSDLTKAAFYFSDDNQSSYAPLLDADGNYVLTMTYDTGILASSTWGKTP